MIAVIQRVNSAQVAVACQLVGHIDKGIMALVAVEKNDSEIQAQKLLNKLLNYRIFADSNDRMNLSLADTGGGLLLVPQFTLAADTNSGNRPSFSPAASPEHGLQLFSYLSELAIQQHPVVAFGQFGADMQVSLINNGPVTFILKA